MVRGKLSDANWQRVSIVLWPMFGFKPAELQGWCEKVFRVLLFGLSIGATFCSISPVNNSFETARATDSTEESSSASVQARCVATKACFRAIATERNWSCATIDGSLCLTLQYLAQEPVNATAKLGIRREIAWRRHM